MQLAPAGDPLIGEVLGRTYRIVRVLGQGGMARLYEAEHLRIDARYAIKVIHDDLARAVREGETLEVCCRFCAKRYAVPPEDLARLANAS